MSSATKRRLVAALESTRAITPGFNNWLLFSATVEAALKALDASWDHVRVDYALRQHEQWYKGDGLYGDGPQFHWDYYNSFVIQPMLLDVLETCGGDSPAWSEMKPRILERSQRYAVILERLIAPDGSFPAIGRSLAYRCGAFQLLAALALRRQLPDALAPGQVRAALTAVIQRTLGAANTFDANGWLTIGLAGHQPTVGRALHLDGKSLSQRGRISSARAGAVRSVLGVGGGSLDVRPRVARRGRANRSRALEGPWVDRSIGPWGGPIPMDSWTHTPYGPFDYEHVFETSLTSFTSSFGPSAAAAGVLSSLMVGDADAPFGVDPVTSTL